jgi:hypothetical protein
LKSVGGLAEPAGEVVAQVLLVLADPGDVTVGPEQDGRNIQVNTVLLLRGLRVSGRFGPTDGHSLD